MRSVASAVCIVLAMVLIPAGVVSGWAKGQLLDESDFVRTFAPLASDPSVQAEVSKQAMGAIEEEIDIDQLTSQVFDGIIDLGLPDRAANALRLLQQPASAGVRSLLQQGVTEFVESDLFASSWERSLRLSHRGLLAAATQDSLATGALTIDQHGEIAIQLGPIIDEVKRSLVDSGFTLASTIPSVTKSFVVAQSDALVTISLVYTLAGVFGWWMPALALLALIAGVLLASNKPRAITSAGVATIIGSVFLLMVFAAAELWLQASAFRLGVSAEALKVVFSHIVSDMRASSWLLIGFGVLLIVLGRVLGPSGWAVKLRARMKKWIPANSTMRRNPAG